MPNVVETGNKPFVANRAQVNNFLSEFVRQSNDGLTDSLVKAHLKNGSEPPTGKYVMMYRGKAGGFSAKPGSFYMDTAHGIVLGYQEGDQRPLWLAVSSFAFEKSLPHSTSRESFSFKPPIGPVIKQLQGPSRNAYYNRPDLREQAVETLGALRWEKALIRFMIPFAAQLECPFVYVLPSHMNKWSAVKNTERGRLRYDITAMRCGFTPGVAGLYCLAVPKEANQTQLNA